LLERIAQPSRTQSPLILQWAYAKHLFEKPLYSERTQSRYAPQFLQRHSPIDVRLNVPSHLVQNAAQHRERLASLARAKPRRPRLTCRSEEAHIFLQWPLTGATGPAKNARRRHCIEENCSRISRNHLLPGGLSADRSFLRRLSSIFDFEFALHGTIVAHSPHNRLSASCAQFRFLRKHD
jgi:hypothetical protein